MTNLLRIVSSGVWLLIGATQGLADQTGTEAGRNPFGRPLPAFARASAESFVSGAPTFVLRATMTAGAGSLANVEGEILQLGEEFEGYRLIAVAEGAAMFARNGVHYPLAIKAMTQDDDEPQEQ